MLQEKRMLNFPVNENLLSEIVSRLKTGFKPLRIILFGSYAYGQPNQDSDLDLLVVVNTPERGIKRYSLVSKLLEPRKIPIDIIVKSPDELSEQLTGFNPFLKEILEKGRVLYESPA
ncbi:MAG: nucleotidyltransferase domain-containing protein [Candidatus Schekmanbacteria bacterium]|nr:nucleotidyltransferase domain-containing protein [Candidatus Schekmanbacteria bacterium]